MQETFFLFLKRAYFNGNVILANVSFVNAVIFTARPSVRLSDCLTIRQNAVLCQIRNTVTVIHCINTKEHCSGGSRISKREGPRYNAVYRCED